jgi:hypothetical protein
MPGDAEHSGNTPAALDATTTTTTTTKSPVYQWMFMQCPNVNECSTPETNRCHKDATCTDIVRHGSFFPTEIYTRGCHWIPRMFA